MPLFKLWCFFGSCISQPKITYASHIPTKSIIEVAAKDIKPSDPIAGCPTQLEEIYTVGKSV